MSDIGSTKVLEDLWGKVVAEIFKKISKPSFETWIEPLTGKILEKGISVITAPNDFSMDWIIERYKKVFVEVLKQNYKNRMYSEQAIGYMMLACNEIGLPVDMVTKLQSSMLSQFDYYTAEEAEKEGVKWFHSLRNV